MISVRVNVVLFERELDSLIMVAMTGKERTQIHFGDNYRYINVSLTDV